MHLPFIEFESILLGVCFLMFSRHRLRFCAGCFFNVLLGLFDFSTLLYLKICIHISLGSLFRMFSFATFWDLMNS